MNGLVIWITGLSGAGKTTLAEELSVRLKEICLRPVLLDGDILRNIFKKGNLDPYAYDRKSRLNLAMNYGLLCKTLSEQGFTVIISTISMFDEVYVWNRKNIKNYFEVYLKVPLSELYLRDPKNIYNRYRNGNLSNVAGLDLNVDEPFSPDVIFDFECQADLWKCPKNITDSLFSELELRAFLLKKNLETRSTK